MYEGLVGKEGEAESKFPKKRSPPPTPKRVDYSLGNRIPILLLLYGSYPEPVALPFPASGGKDRVP